MKPSVHILVTVRHESMLNAGLLVFKTLRVGFPTAEIFVYGNNLNYATQNKVFEVLPGYCTFRNLQEISHDAWVESLVLNSESEFWICDTDVIFYDKVEDWKFTTDIAGRYQPEYYEPWTNTISKERIHTCLMHFNPGGVRGSIMKWSRENVPSVFPFATIPFIRQNFIPDKERPILYDTCAGLYYTCSRHIFTEEQDNAFAHLHAGTYADEVSKCSSFKDLQTCHSMLFDNLEFGRELNKIQSEFYRKHSIK
jgi:hypothetical protein